MKIVRFTRGNSHPCFGLVIGEHAISFASLQLRSGRHHACLDDSDAYLAALPESEQLARELLIWAETHLDRFNEAEKTLLGSVRLLAPIEVKALFDLGLTPRHLANSADTLAHYEKDNPQTGPLIEAFRKMLLAPRPAATPGVPERLSYYKCNLNSVVGDDVTVPWPAYTSRLDIEPELAVVYGNAQQPVAGYCIFNDISARDVQAAEIIGGFCLTKDMASGNQLGPWLVTADEVGNPMDLAVSVTVDGAPRFQGSTREISHPVEAVFAWLGLICPLASGTVMGLGTIPDCTGLDHDDFLDPSADIRISIDKLGTLRCRFGEPTRLLPSRWPVRPALQKYHG
jgi:2-keto-4-pentenoate hydratase/2-oxohepta-3-ene-1,7-dioic acid hydratase in catechol pathway